MKNYFPLFLGIIQCMFGQYNEIKDQSDLLIKTPSLQKRQTAKVRLSNGMGVYIISDPDCDQSAAAIAVNVGAWNDPDQYPGMAHFLEHMLFMGTKPYPQENDFSQYIGDYAGKYNAYTAPDRTVYMFSVNHEGFLGALDRFSHFFIDPIFNPKGAKRELFVVDQEHAKNIENDNWRLFMVSKETGNPNHPNARFCTGNSQTLSKIPNSALRSWFETNYSANLMHGIVYSSLPLEELKTLIEEKFTPILNKGNKALRIKQPLFATKQKKSIIYVEPVRNTHKISIEWELPKTFASDFSKTANLLAFALNRGQEYGLKETLRQQGYIEELTVFTEKIGSHHCLFQISIELSEKGLKNKQEVLRQCFAALHVIQKTKLPPYIFHEMQNINSLQYSYQQRVDAFTFVRDHAHDLVDEPLSTYPMHSVMATKFDTEKMQQLLEHLTVENAQIYIMAPQEKLDIVLDKQEHWMGSRYALANLKKSQINFLKKLDLKPITQIPPPNIFLPNHLEILPISKKDRQVRVIADDDYGKVFYMRDTSFLTPESSLQIHIKSPLLDGSLQAKILAKIFIEQARQAIAPLITAAKEANINIDAFHGRHRIDLCIEGFSEKIPLFIEELFKKITTKIPTQEEYERARIRLAKKYENQDKELPIMQALDNLQAALCSDEYTSQEKLDAINKLNYEDYITFHKKFFRKNYIEGFFIGNLSLQDAESIYSDLRHFIGAHSFPTQEHSQRKIFSIKEDKGPFILQDKTNALGSGIVLSIDLGEFTFEKRGAQEILSQIIHEAFFTTLRTVQKTGYIAKAWPIEMEKRLFQNFAVQSATHETLDLLYRFELFLEDFVNHFSESTTEERFNIIRKNQIHKLKNTSKNLSVTGALYDKMAFTYEDMQWIEKRIKGLEKLTFSQFQEYVHTSLSKENRKRLAILVNGQARNRPFVYERITAHDFPSLGEYVESNAIVQQK